MISSVQPVIISHRPAPLFPNPKNIPAHPSHHCKGSPLGYYVQRVAWRCRVQDMLRPNGVEDVEPIWEYPHPGDH
ncbi:unnamed protein product [Somion occarium]|uniref:Uncharacterized protein n=1 Tax=Somion occarium TaxID=3059160 RepID=A0ABP1D1P8_9APHY